MAGTAAEIISQRDAETGAVARSSAANASKARPVSDGWHRFTVDVWITDLNTFEFGIYKRSRNRAKSRQFSADMDILAEVVEDGERTGLIGYREELWKQRTGMDKRLVFKLFSETLNWRATMDLMIGRSLQLTLGARGEPVLAYAINTSDDNSIIYLERSANKWPVLPENFAFFIARGNRADFYRLRRDLFSVGGDYTLFDGQGHKVGHLDGKLISLGGFWRGKVRTDHADKKLLTVMKLFVGTIGFNTACRRHVKRLWRDLRAGRLEPRLERQEAEFYLNPRRVR
jgi:hypothetical protein